MNAGGRVRTHPAFGPVYVKRGDAIRTWRYAEGWWGVEAAGTREIENGVKTEVNREALTERVV